MKDNILWIFLHLQRSGGTTFNGHLQKRLKPGEFIHLGNPWVAEKERRKIIPFDKLPLGERKKAKVIVGHKAYYGVHNLVPGKIPRYITFVRDPAERIVSYYNSRIWHGKIPSFERWYRSRRKNEMVHFYSSKYGGNEDTSKVPSFFGKLNRLFPGEEKRIYFLKFLLRKIGFLEQNKEKEFENAKKMLDLCWFTGITEKSDRDFKILFKSLGVDSNKWINYAVTGDKKTQEINPLHKKIEKRFILDNKTRKKICKDNPLDYKLYKYALKLNKKLREKLISLSVFI